MRVIIAGSRNLKINWGNLLTLDKLVEVYKIPVSEVVSGTASGADSLGELWASLHELPIKRFPADWETHSRAAGPIRNREMAMYADILILLWDGKSRGSASMLNQATKYGLLIYQDPDIAVTF